MATVSRCLNNNSFPFEAKQHLHIQGAFGKQEPSAQWRHCLCFSRTNFSKCASTIDEFKHGSARPSHNDGISCSDIFKDQTWRAASDRSHWEDKILIRLILKSQNYNKKHVTYPSKIGYMFLERHKFTSLIRGCVCVLQKARHPPAFQMLKSNTVKHIDCSLNSVPQLVVIVWCWESWILLNPQWSSWDRVPKIGEGTKCKTTFLRLATSLTHWILLAAARQQGHWMPYALPSRRNRACSSESFQIKISNSRNTCPTCCSCGSAVSELSCPMYGLKGLLRIHTSVRNQELDCVCVCVSGSWFP